MICRSSILIGCFLCCTSCAHEPRSKFEVRGFWHRVEEADSARSLAERYGADANAIAEINDLQRGKTIAGRGEVFIPKRGGALPGTHFPLGGKTPKEVKVAERSTTPETRGKCAKSGSSCLNWPIKGKIASLFGKKGNGHHDGIDVLAEQGTPVHAALDGTVLYSGDDIKGYGNLVIVRHELGILSIYAHNERNLVKEGDAVKTGQAIARVGKTGSASRPCLHFEVRVGEEPRDPLLYLP